MCRLPFLAMLVLLCFLAGCGSGNPPTASISAVVLSTNSFDFGNDLVGHALTNVVVTIANPGRSPATLAPALSGDPSFTIAATGGTCGGSISAGASCTLAIQYLPTVSGTQSALLDVDLSTGSGHDITLTGTSTTLTGTVTTTNNPQVALYSITLPSAGSVTVSFGPTVSYGRQTWTRSITAAGPVSVYVAGMLANMTYHMQATVTLANGVSATDVDHIFATGAPSAIPVMTASTTSGMTPQPGVEQLTILGNAPIGLVITDLKAQVLWTYLVTPGTTSEIEGAKLMPNGDFLLSIGEGSSYTFSGAPVPSTAVKAIREIDLGGNTVREVTIDQLNQKMTAAGYNIPLQQFHHDITPLPNGHWIVLSNTSQSFANVVDYGPSTVLGDVIIDLDTNLNPVWVWNSFDHLDVNRHPWNFPDWTHSNAVVYSPDDGNLLVSMRHQNWVLKVDYKNGTGAGDVLWRFGEGGDFTLYNGTDPADWPYAQHFPTFFSPNTAGNFTLGLMDNGDDRQFPSDVMCDGPGQPSCAYTTIPVYQIDEGAKTASLAFHQILPVSLYSNFGGSADLLANGDIEYDLCGLTISGSSGSDIFEVTPTSTPETVWQMQIRGSSVYRGYRLPSLYPGVQW